MGGFASMRKKNFKGRCEKRAVSKCMDVYRTYGPIQYAYADMLATDDTVSVIAISITLKVLN